MRGSDAPGPSVEVLGSTRVRGADGTPAALTRLERRLVAALAWAQSRGLTPDDLAGALWSGEPPRTGRQSLHNHVSHLRRKVGGGVVEWREERYRLAAGVSTDTARLVELVAGSRAASAEGDPAAAVALLDTARSLSRGTPFADLDQHAEVEGERAWLEELLEEAADLHAAALIADGRTEAAAAELERLVGRQPGREPRWALLVRALAAQGRRTSALEAYQRARRALVDGYGVEPGPLLQALQRELLDSPQDGGLWSQGAIRVVGRRRTVSALTAALRDGGRVWLHGEAGIGKSAVLSVVGAAWSDGDVVALDCGDTLWTALGPVGVLFERLGPRLERLGLPATVDALTAGALREPLPRLGLPRSLTQRAVEVLAAALCSEPGTLLLLDDVDRAGPTTRAILDATVGASVGVAVLMTSREGGEGLPSWPDDATLVALHGLDREGLGALVAEVTGAPGQPPEVVDRLHALTAGHPLLAVELLRELGVAGEAASLADRLLAAQPAIPVRLRSLLQGRIDRLPQAARRALDAAAVMGQVLDIEVLRRVTDIAQLEPAVDLGMLRAEPGGLRFAHDLFRLVAYDAVPQGRRTELHHAIGTHSASPRQRAQHLLAAADLDPQAAIAAARHAGEHSFAEQAHADAALLFAEAAALADRVGADRVEVLDLTLEAADARRLAGEAGHAEPLLDVAEAAVGLGNVDLRRRATVAAVQLGEAVDPGPLQQRAVRLADRALALETEDPWRARLAATSSQLYATAGDPERCRELFVEALALVGDDDEVVADVHPFGYMALGHPDDLARREAVGERLRLAASRTGNVVAAWEAGHLRFSCALMRGDGAGARRVHAEMDGLTAQVGDAGRRWSLAYQRAALACAAGDLDESEQHAAEALRIGQGVAPSRALGAYAGQLFELRRLQGRLAELADTLAYLIDTQPEIAAWRAVGALVFAETDREAGLALFDALADNGFAALPHDFAWLAGMLSLGRAAVASGDAGRAAAIQPHLVPYEGLVCWQGTCTYGPVAEVLAELADRTGDPRGAAWARRAAELTGSLRA